MKIVIASVVLQALVVCGVAQQSEDATVQLIVKATETTIKLRWAPTSPRVWKYANRYGYTLEKVVFMENGKILPNKQVRVIPSSPFKPRSLNEWEVLVEQDDYAAVAAQSLYGESFEVTDNVSSDMVRMMNQARELENRYAFALHAADMSIQVAAWSGLYFEDEEVHNDYKYLYRVYVNTPAEILVSDTSTVLVGLEDYKALPPIRNASVEFDNHIAKIEWSGLLADQYGAYWVEKSEDGQHFTKLTERPIVFPVRGDAPAPSVLTKLDSLQQNHKTYYYRVAGVDAFGDVGAPSEVVSGQALPAFRYPPVIETGTTNAKGGAVIGWSFPGEGEPQLQGFSLFREHPTTHQRELVHEAIPATARTVVDSLPHGANYYLIVAHDQYGRSTISLPYLVQLEDSIPPRPPTGLAGRIDTLGHVWLEWKENGERDLSGYKVYRSNFEDQEMTALPGPLVTSNHYVDTVSVKTLTEQVYYQVRAFDKRQNPSGPSDVLLLKKPDLIPPISPVIKKVVSDSLGILIHWEESPSADVVKYLLYRRSSTESAWTLLQVMGKETDGFYLDKQLVSGSSYAYLLLVVDDDGLESQPTAPMIATWVRPVPLPAITQLFQSVNADERHLRLSWDYAQQEVEKYWVFKSRNGAPMSLYEVTTGDEREITDTYDLSDEVVVYQVQALFGSGEVSLLSEKVRFDFKEE